MDRYIKYKQVCKLFLFNDQLKNATSSHYNIFSSTISSVTVNTGGTNYNSSNLGFKIDGGGGSGLLLSATIASGVITAITVVDGGINYSNAPNITTTSGVNSITVTAAGSGYTSTPNISIIDPGDGVGFQVGTVTLTTNTITGISVLNAGQGYTRPPTLLITGGGGSGGTATCVIGTGASFTVPSFTNSKRLRYLLNANFNNVELSKYARCVLESAHIPSLANINNQVILLRLVTSTEDKHYDSLKGVTGNPTLLQTVVTASTTILNNSQDFFNIKIPQNFLSKQFIEVEMEVPNTTGNIDFTNAQFRNSFNICLKIIDVDPELTEDRPQIDMANYNSGKIPLRIYS